MCVILQNVDIDKERELERQARIEASLREREREVQKARSEQTKEIDREREQHKREEAIQHFKALMSDMVRCSAAFLFSYETCCNVNKCIIFSLSPNLFVSSPVTFSQDLIRKWESNS